ncbi:hypothetical protein [Aquimarina algiphila]|uniref:hypothetical protein n=1 Tax=Aquimarina algiphila TaxID=2047982 RepID=UPI00232ED70D|nr:hypothetical protein [Aquimarina algiphila]
MKNYRLTPWDTKSLGFKTAELLDLDNLDTEQQLIEVLNMVEKLLIKQSVIFVYTRIKAQNIIAKKILQEKGYYFAESSISVVKNKVQKFTPYKCPNIDFVDFEDQYMNNLKEIARDSFDYSRFHEDPNITENSARNRYYNWIDDLINQNQDVKVAKKGNKIIGFSIQETNMDNNKSKLILAGCAKGREIFVKSLWNEILIYNKYRGVSSIETMISSANVGVFNVYNYFDFKVENTFFGFHKLFKKQSIL